MKTNNYRSEAARRAGRRSQQDKAYRASRATIEAAEEAFDAAAYGKADWATEKAARDALYELDPRNGRFT